ARQVAGPARRWRRHPRWIAARHVPRTRTLGDDGHAVAAGLMIRRAPASVESGTRIGPYEIVGWLGAGGMGDVYRAHDPRLGREVAIKVLPPAFSGDAQRLRRFEQEARAVARL